MTHVYYKDAVGALVVFDITRAATLAGAQNWRIDIEEKVFLPNSNPIPVVLCANKADLPRESWAMTEEKIESFAKRNKFHSHFLTSALENTYLSEAVDTLVHRVFELVEYTTLLSQGRQTPDSLKVNSTENEQGCCRFG